MRAAAPVTLRDVAVLAGVSVATASKALRGDRRISEATRERVRATADRLDYTPNALAQSFASGRSRTIGVFTHRAQTPFTRPVLIGAIKELGLLGHATLVFDADVRGGRWRDEDVRRLQARKAEGVLVVGTNNELVSRSVTDRFDSPVVYAFTDSDDPADPVFQIDSAGAGRLAVEHLLATGRRRIAHVTGGRDSLSVRGRETGMAETLAAAGLRTAHPPLYGGWSQDWGATGTEQLITAGVQLDAIFCGNDSIAFGALRVLEAHGVRVPDDIAIVGVDNWEGVMLDQGTRRLTSVDLRLERLGAAAARRLALGEDADDTHAPEPANPQRRVVTPVLVEGPSTATA
ncbi:LacI family DNA-binding transcriptional regulator [Jiangella sp. DSM 45060]|uniref:LacI family DNA-binding transcriptional regulator n=1 Tax=Jiangella sp. DSM 45060 TaxID=1798224 RepID=UPI000B82100D|nr:LacI family DNA-binding transcriptional regulator [Jiangella sp. DSM 45060]